MYEKLIFYLRLTMLLRARKKGAEIYIFIPGKSTLKKDPEKKKFLRLFFWTLKTLADAKSASNLLPA